MHLVCETILIETEFSVVYSFKYIAGCYCFFLEGLTTWAQNLFLWSLLNIISV